MTFGFTKSAAVASVHIGPELRGEVTLTGDHPALAAQVALDQDGSWDFGEQLRAEVTLSTFLTTIQPGLQGDAPSQLWGGFQVYVDGEQIPPWQLGEAIAFSEHLAGTSTIGFTVPMRGEGDKQFNNPHGTFVEALGPPPGGKASIDLETLFFVGPLKTPITLLTDGMVENVTEGVGPTGDQRTYAAIGKHGRYDRRKVTVTHPPGHGLSMEEVIESILAEMDLDVDLVGVDAEPRYKEMAAVDTLGWQLIQELLAIKGQALVWDRDGFVALRNLGWRGEDPTPDWTFGARDLLDETGKITQPAIDGPTRVKITGSEQVIHDDDEGRHTEITQVDFYAIATVPYATHQQSAGDCTAAPTPITTPTQTPYWRIVRRVFYEREFEGSTLISERERTFRYLNAEAARGQNDTDGVVTCILRYMRTLGGPTVSWYREHFIETERIERTFHYNEEDYLYRVVTSQYGWYNPRRAIQQGFFNTTSRVYEINFLSGKVSWTLEGVVNDGDTFREVKRTEVEHSINEDGYIEVTDIIDSAYFARPGTDTAWGTWYDYYYADGRQSKDTVEFVQRIAGRRISYAVRADGQVMVTTLDEDWKGSAVSSVVEYFDGFLPAAEIKDVILPDPDLYPNGVPASRHETKTIEAEFISEELEGKREIWDEALTNPFVENVDEALEVAERIVREGSAVPITFALPINPLIRPGHICRVSLPGRSQPELTVYVTDTLHEQRPTAAGLAGVTTIQGRVFVI
jgi:hypothetical protein